MFLLEAIEDVLLERTAQLMEGSKEDQVIGLQL